VIVPRKDYTILKDHMMLDQWSQVLRRSMQVMDRFGALDARRVEAGLYNVRDLGNGPTAVAP
jgi:hypothetical protein